MTHPGKLNQIFYQNSSFPGGDSDRFLEKSSNFKAVANELSSHGKSDQILMSVIAGYSIESMRKSFPNVQNLIRIMTNTGCLIKEGAIAVTPSDEVPLDVVQEVIVSFFQFSFNSCVVF